MADITMCTNTKCPLRVFCYRYMAVANKHRQSVARHEPVDLECDHFEDMRNKGLQWYDGVIEIDLFVKELANSIAEDFESLSNSSAKSILEDNLKGLLK